MNYNDIKKLRYWQPDRKLGISPLFSIDIDFSVMPLYHDIITQRQPQPRSFTWRFGGKERLHDLVFDIVGYAVTIVLYFDLNMSIGMAGI